MLASAAHYTSRENCDESVLRREHPIGGRLPGNSRSRYVLGRTPRPAGLDAGSRNPPKRPRKRMPPPRVRKYATSLGWRTGQTATRWPDRRMASAGAHGRYILYKFPRSLNPTQARCAPRLWVSHAYISDWPGIPVGSKISLARRDTHPKLRAALTKCIRDLAMAPEWAGKVALSRNSAPKRLLWVRENEVRPIIGKPRRNAARILRIIERHIFNLRYTLNWVSPYRHQMRVARRLSLHCPHYFIVRLCIGRRWYRYRLAR